MYVCIHKLNVYNKKFKNPFETHLMHLKINYCADNI